MRRILSCLGAAVIAAALVVSCGTSGGAQKASLKAGTYSATVPGMHAPLSVEVNLTASAITGVKVTKHGETPGVSDWAVEAIPARVVEKQSLAVDVVTGVSVTSRAILSGVEDCLKQAGADPAAFKQAAKTAKAPDQTLSADVVIVGGGGAGLSASVSATDAGATVILVERSGFLGGNSIVAGGIYNTAWPERQDHWPGQTGVEVLITSALAEKPVSAEHKALQDKVRAEFDAYKKTDKTLFDSPSWHALQTWNGGDKIGLLPVIEEMTANSLNGVKWLQSMKMEFFDGVSQGAGSLYQRTISAKMPNGTGYIKAFRDTLQTRSGFTQLLETTVKGLIVEGGKVVGVNAEAKDGHKITLRATRGVILATGGFAGNVDLRVKYGQGEKWPDLGPSLNTTNMPGVTGDGIFFAQNAGARLVNMEQIQLLHMCNPQTGATGDIIRDKGVAVNFFVNKDGKRFVREDGRRDEISKAIIAQQGSICTMILSADSFDDVKAAMTLDGRTLDYMLENKLSGYVKADTLADLARTIGVNADNLAAAVKEFNSHVDSQTPDEFGRTLFSTKLVNGPWYAYPRSPAAHHTMGGVLIDTDCRALAENGAPIPGLYCAGEITGVVHGGNRLGGNAIVDFTVFGRIAGQSAAAGK